MRGRGSDETRRSRIPAGDRRFLFSFVHVESPGIAETENRSGKNYHGGMLSEGSM